MKQLWIINRKKHNNFVFCFSYFSAFSVHKGLSQLRGMYFFFFLLMLKVVASALLSQYLHSSPLLPPLYFKALYLFTYPPLI